MKILAIGDVVGPAAVEYLARRLGSWREANGVDLVCVNGENAAVGNGMGRADAQALFDAGADVITTGNHIWKRRDVYDFLDDNPYVIRPANYPSTCPGKGSTIVEAAGKRILVANVSGVVFLEPLDCPFNAVERILRENEGKYDAALLDVHAEATSEKAAIARCFDGRFAAVWGTHTHVQTNDARILPRGTAFITDLGMTGPDESILGVDPDIIIGRMRSHMPYRFDLAGGDVRCDAALFTLDRDLRASAVETVRI